ncbi:MAG: hypothetical protein HWE25_06205 [Alphaproteobacteria bacterium]|nr:hypothetical protein [Alphaproteobacteria bacterium]
MPSNISARWIAIGISILTVTAGIFWYGGPSAPLTTAEVSRYMAAIDRHPHIFKTPEDKAAFQAFLEADDGAPFYTVNLYKYYHQAQYGASEPSALSGREAFDRFSSVMVKLLAEQASHPIFGSGWMDANTGGWQRLVIVRYRSRRDIAEVFSNPAFATASNDKWAGIEANQRFLVQGLHIPALPYGLASLLLAIILLVCGLGRIRRFRQKPEGMAV